MLLLEILVKENNYSTASQNAKVEIKTDVLLMKNSISSAVKSPSKSQVMNIMKLQYQACGLMSLQLKLIKLVTKDSCT